jgi:hypothetical protein
MFDSVMVRYENTKEDLKMGRWVVRNRMKIGKCASVHTILAVSAIAAVAVVGLSISPVLAQTQVASAPVPGPQVVSQAIAGFPSGGEPLKAQISDLIYQRPELAADVANYLQNDAAGLNAAQKDAVEAGLADGLNRLGVVGQVAVLFNPALLGVGAGAAAAGGAAAVATSQKSSTTAVSPN